MPRIQLQSKYPGYEIVFEIEEIQSEIPNTADVSRASIIINEYLYQAAEFIGQGNFYRVERYQLTGAKPEACQELIAKVPLWKTLLALGIDIKTIRDRAENHYRYFRQAHPAFYTDILKDKKNPYGHYLIIESVLPGKSLAYYLKQDKGFVKSNFIPIIQAIALELTRLHKLGICHGDVNPGNFLLNQKPDKSFSAIAIDFEESAKIGTKVIVPTLSGLSAYAPPELKCPGEELIISEKRDIYAFGHMIKKLMSYLELCATENVTLNQIDQWAEKAQQREEKSRPSLAELAPVTLLKEDLASYQKSLQGSKQPRLVINFLTLIQEYLKQYENETEIDIALLYDLVIKLALINIRYDPTFSPHLTSKPSEHLWQKIKETPSFATIIKKYKFDLAQDSCNSPSSSPKITPRFQ
ncbi:MAG: serine/threonine protein kinase [Gammaproteobacteria bacterium]|jgi:serine/threonine protein kinase|nr:serine/threonine protein kinase [Gammaproteobacteria bacterium]